MKKNILRTFLFTMVLLFMYLCARNGMLKYMFAGCIIYILILTLLFKKSSVIDKKTISVCIRFVSPAVFYLLYSLVVMMINQNFDFYKFCIKQFIFMSLPIILAYVLTNILKKNDLTKYVFWSIIIIFFINNVTKFNFEDLMESTEAYIFGFYAVYYFINKDKRYFILSIILMGLAHKRIVYLSLVICILFVLFSNKRKKNSPSFLLIWSLIIISSYIWIFIISSGKINDIFIKFNINDMGRLDVYYLFIDDYKFRIGYLGKGLGYVLYKLNKLSISDFSNLHNDILMFYIEMGFIGNLFFYGINFKNLKYLQDRYINSFYIYYIFMIYNYILLFTDNISIYMYYLFPVYLIIFKQIKYDIKAESKSHQI
ncbi:O-antigen ligase family protein [Clostridium sp.]